jgi:hypothetical protein
MNTGTSKDKAERAGRVVDVLPSTAEQAEIAHLRVKLIELTKKIDAMDTPSLERIRTYYEPKLRKRGHKLHVPIPKFLDDLYDWHKSRKKPKGD